ncbi:MULTISPECIES: hypothetical protein [unclassified Enterococcus]|uniref:hypothetical protein n=1 Tax=unclassified Enterococcus TaxID=2608891 RepID=UPI0015574A2B|nr:MULTISPECIES: hypothetical protein [unclassified Enterococcus]MBS7576953.1 hypothetical protein [Enterococcus sp. MMGLQ5-2]MBS7584360.1 hypothetical protein [Enterococcus sp. MMGLQ5-1]NPD12215.1 hypothetical protein [Enterococcus sp. MMGLQ5-1]NPD36787.1 hypothetical protein [Enterococcus sp. MMGLQ5-2]
MYQYQYVGWVTGKVYAEHKIKCEAHRLLVAQYPTYVRKISNEVTNKERDQLRNPIYPEPLFIRKVVK